MAKLHLQILQPVQMKIDAEFDHIIVPGVEGDFGIYAGHTAFITQIRPGVLQLYNEGSIEKYSIHDGFVTVENNQVNIVCEIIEKYSEIDESRANNAKDRAEKRLKKSKGNIDFRRAEAALKRALSRLEAISKSD
ncbi:MAG: ATP synthase F1 subunit epsilon [Candidatus Cloacimonetes bacterium]|nr:ATP synthase F1 subunit epsilon [Candidatus Cloacimonadota bacterium]